MESRTPQEPGHRKMATRPTDCPLSYSLGTLFRAAMMDRLSDYPRVTVVNVFLRSQRLFVASRFGKHDAFTGDQLGCFRACVRERLTHRVHEKATNLADDPTIRRLFVGVDIHYVANLGEHAFVASRFSEILVPFPSELGSRCTP
jgi:hypothetical protein